MKQMFHMATDIGLFIHGSTVLNGCVGYRECSRPLTLYIAFLSSTYGCLSGLSFVVVAFPRCLHS